MYSIKLKSCLIERVLHLSFTQPLTAKLEVHLRVCKTV